MDPRSIRTNNPGAMNYGPFARKWGATGTDGRLAIFPDVDTGYRAMSGLLDIYARRGQNSVSSIIGGLPSNPDRAWAPRGVDNNSTDLYIKTVASKLGVDPNMPLPPELRQPLMRAMAEYEAGTGRVPISSNSVATSQGQTPMTPTPYSGMSPDDVSQSRKLALALMGQASDTSPVGHWTQALARALQGGVGGMYQAQARQGEKQGNDALVQALAGGGTPDAATLTANPWTRDIGKSLFLTQAKTRMAGPEFGKQGAIFQGEDGKFYSIQFGSRGERRIEPVETGGKGLTPAKGVMHVGDELVDKATGQGVRNVGPQLRNEEIQKGAGKNIAKVTAELPEAKARLDLVSGGLDRVKDSVRSVVNHPGLGRVVGGLYEAYAPNVSEKARNAGTELENLKVKISGIVLQTMRDMSKTGGAVGQVTEREWPRLENMIANLDPRQGEEQFKKNARQIVTYVDEVKRALKEAYDADVATAGSVTLPQLTPGASPTPQAPSPGAGQGAPPEAIQMLRQNPTPQTRAQFDEVFGPGASARALGAP